MKLKTLLIINTVVATLFGLAFLIVPQQLMAQYGTTLSEGGTVIARLFGASLLGFGIVSCMARDSGPSKALTAILMGFFVADLVGCVVAVFAQLTGTVNALGWSTVAIYALLAIGFGMFAFKKEAD